MYHSSMHCGLAHRGGPVLAIRQDEVPGHAYHEDEVTFPLASREESGSPIDVYSPRRGHQR